MNFNTESNVDYTDYTFKQLYVAAFTSIVQRWPFNTEAAQKDIVDTSMKLAEKAYRTLNLNIGTKGVNASSTGVNNMHTGDYYWKSCDIVPLSSHIPSILADTEWWDRMHKSMQEIDVNFWNSVNNYPLSGNFVDADFQRRIDALSAQVNKDVLNGVGVGQSWHETKWPSMVTATLSGWTELGTTTGNKEATEADVQKKTVPDSIQSTLQAIVDRLDRIEQSYHKQHDQFKPVLGYNYKPWNHHVVG